MELNHLEVTAPPRAAASVVMLRDSAAGMEVLLQKRHADSSVLGGAHVFPGGKLDAADMELDMSAHLDQDVQALHEALCEPALSPMEAAGLHVAAFREAFEECGLLLAHGASQRVAELATLRVTQGLDFNRPALIQPHSCEIEGQRVVCYPGDERHPVTQRALPGPSRLVFRNRRFEPFEGFQAFFE